MSHTFSTTQAFFSALREGNLAELEALVRDEPELTGRADERGFTPLTLSVYLGQEEVVRWLLQSGVAVDTRDRAGNTALMGAVFKGNLGMVKLLLDAGAEVNAANSQGSTPLAFAATYSSGEVVGLLLEHGARTDLRDAGGKSPLDHAISKRNRPAIERLQQEK